MLTASEKLRRIVDAARGDDLERATRAFAGMTSAALDEPHGESGKTRREVLDGYRRERQEWNRAKLLAESLDD